MMEMPNTGNHRFKIIATNTNRYEQTYKYYFRLRCVPAHAVMREPHHFFNPVIKSDVPDPSVIRAGDKYYLAGTSGNATPVYPIYRSSDLVNWSQIGAIFDMPPAWTKGEFWAPELYSHNGKYYCYYTAKAKSDGISCIGVAVADSPEGPFTDHGPLVRWTNEAIDAFVFDDNG